MIRLGLASIVLLLIVIVVIIVHWHHHHYRHSHHPHPLPHPHLPHHLDLPPVIYLIVDFIERHLAAALGVGPEERRNRDFYSQHTHMNLARLAASQTGRKEGAARAALVLSK